MGTDLMLRYGRLFGRKLPLPEHVPASDAARALAWMAGIICLATFASSAVRLCLLAQDSGLELKSASFITVGEPLTAAKRSVIEATGARAIPRYAFTEGGILGYGCGAPAEPDDMHLLKGNVAVVQSPRAIEGISVAAFYFTSLLQSAPKILINVETGDCGALEERACSCPFGGLGYSTHISGVRSFEKLTGEGVTFAGTDLTRIIEEVLPARFGGHAIDYQIVEEEDRYGLPHLSLLVDPTVGKINESDMVKCFLAELGRPTEARKIMAEIWSQLSTLDVRRAPPLATRAGKVFPFHLSMGVRQTKNIPAKHSSNDAVYG
jgi:hypothetical protein